MPKNSSIPAILSNHIAIIDIGSNSIRLVIFKTMGRFPFPLFNERVTCRLGEGLEKSNNLQSERIAEALKALKRFSSILKSLPNLSAKIVATAAARRANNADKFLEPAQKILGHKIQVLGQQDEANLVSVGLLSNFDIRDGLIADLGGGSLELVYVKDRVLVHSTSLDVGHLSVKPVSEIFDMMQKVDWLKKANGLDLYGVGGSFRALGSAYIHKTKYPLGMLHALTMSKMATRSLLNQICSEPPDLDGVPQGRCSTMPKASEIINCLLMTSKVNKDEIMKLERYKHPHCHFCN